MSGAVRTSAGPVGIGFDFALAFFTGGDGMWNNGTASDSEVELEDEGEIDEEEAEEDVDDEDFRSSAGGKGGGTAECLVSSTSLPASDQIVHTSVADFTRCILTCPFLHPTHGISCRLPSYLA